MNIDCDFSYRPLLLHNFSQEFPCECARRGSLDFQVSIDDGDDTLKADRWPLQVTYRHQKPGERLSLPVRPAAKSE